MNEVSEPAARKSHAQWVELMSAYEAGDLPQREFCERHDVAYTAFGYWRKRLRSSALPVMPAVEPLVELRKSFDGLSALVKEKLAEDPLSGQLFVFVNRKRNYLKALYFDRSGYALWAKRLEQGQFHCAQSASGKVALNVTDLKFLLEGIDVRSVHRYKRYRHRSVGAIAV